MEEKSERFVNIDHDSPMLLPSDLRDWVSAEHMVHFMIGAVKALDLSLARINSRGTGHAQYPPAMMLGLLIYCYATDTFCSCRIEIRTHDLQISSERKQRPPRLLLPSIPERESTSR
jgi:hypothetical protein